MGSLVVLAAVRRRWCGGGIPARKVGLVSQSVQPILLNGSWVASRSAGTFQAVNPTLERPMPQVFPVSSWSEIDSVIGAAAAASREMRGWPGSRFADFLEAYALEIESRADLLVETAHA